MKPQVVALLLLALVCLQPAAGEKLVSCCLDTSDKCFPRQIVVSYYHQEAGKGCQHSATVFMSKAGKRLCAPAAHKSKCVQELVAFLDKRNKSKKQ
uniref:Chemokine interleukin-8-like domain-containing protein n=1 Tax=Hippocampus comes TaxID=109280 RepID=A0A3Q3DA11_HIPCM